MDGEGQGDCPKTFPTQGQRCGAGPRGYRGMAGMIHTICAPTRVCVYTYLCLSVCMHICICVYVFVCMCSGISLVF